MYPTLREATADRLAIRLGPAGRQLAPVLLLQLPLWLGLDADALEPISRMHGLHSPLLVAAGTRDRHTPIAETRRIVAAAAEPKTLWEVDGAAHVDLAAYAPVAYRAHILAFLAEHLR